MINLRLEESYVLKPMRSPWNQLDDSDIVYLNHSGTDNCSFYSPFLN